MVILSVLALHIPDGFLSVAISLVFWLITAVLLTFSIRQSRDTFDERLAPLAGIMAAFIFAGQMINFPVLGGTSGHLLGGALAAIALGPWVGMLVMACVIGVQALLFQDGGLLVMGANIFNMGLITALIGFGLYRSVAGQKRPIKLMAAGVGAWLSVMAGALLTGLQLWLSGTAELNIVMPAMLSVHALIGIGEALITVAALTFILQTRPDLLEESQARGGAGWVAGGIIATGVVLLLSPFASSNPDGLERVAENLGFLEAGQSAPYNLLPDYTIAGLGSNLSTIVAGLIGAVVVGGIVLYLARLSKKM